MCEIHWHNLHDFTVNQVPDLHAESHADNHVVGSKSCCVECFIVLEVQNKRMGRINVHPLFDHRGEGCGRGTDHLIHGLANRAHVQLVQFKGIGHAARTAHHQVSNYFNISVR